MSEEHRGQRWLLTVGVVAVGVAALAIWCFSPGQQQKLRTAALSELVQLDQLQVQLAAPQVVQRTFGHPSRFGNSTRDRVWHSAVVPDGNGTHSFLTAIGGWALFRSRLPYVACRRLSYPCDVLLCRSGDPEHKFGNDVDQSKRG